MIVKRLALAAALALVLTKAGIVAATFGADPARASDDDAVRAANATFYEAIQSSDLAVMDALWAEGPAVSVVHPGWPNVTGRDRVMESWRLMFESGQDRITGVTPQDTVIEVYDDMALVLVYEAIGGQTLITTNIFLREGDDWRLTLHQASPTPPNLIRQ